MSLRKFARRARRGKGGIRVFFGEHGTLEGTVIPTKLLAEHNGTHVVESGTILDRKKARRFSRRFKGLARGWQRKTGDEYLKVMAERWLKFLEEKRGKIMTVEFFTGREIKKMKRLEQRESVEMARLPNAFKESISSGLRSFNDLLNVSAQAHRIRERAIVRNLSRVKKNPLAFYGTTHSAMFRELKKARPDAERIMGSKVFDHHLQLMRLKIMGKALNPERSFLAKGFLRMLISPEVDTICKKLGVPQDDPKVNLFVNALLDTLPEQALEEAIKKLDFHYEGEEIICDDEAAFFEILKKNNFINVFALPAPKLPAFMEHFSRKAYAKNLRLIQVAYPPRVT